MSSSTPLVLLMIGVNGSGKTTSIAKIAHMLKQDGKRVMLAAADTFRAAAIEQSGDLGRAGRRYLSFVIRKERIRPPSSMMLSNQRRRKISTS